MIANIILFSSRAEFAPVFRFSLVLPVDILSRIPALTAPFFEVAAFFAVPDVAEFFASLKYIAAPNTL